MSLSRDVLLFSIVLMLWAVQIESSGYGTSNNIVITSLGIGLIGLIGGFFSSLNALSQDPEPDSSE